MSSMKKAIRWIYDSYSIAKLRQRPRSSWLIVFTFPWSVLEVLHFMGRLSHGQSKGLQQLLSVFVWETF